MLQAAYFNRDLVLMMGDPIDDACLKRNFDLCRAVNLINLACVLDDMIAAGLPKEQAECFRGSAEALLQLMRTENNRLHFQARAALTTPPDEGE